jgi:hypothetical protein
MMLCMGQDCKRGELCRFLRDIVPLYKPASDHRGCRWSANCKMQRIQRLPGVGVQPRAMDDFPLRVGSNSGFPNNDHCLSVVC